MWYYIIVKGLILQEDLTILNTTVPKYASKYMNQNW